MNFDWAEWGPPLAVLVGGLALGAFFLRGRSSSAGTVAAEGHLADLAANRASAVEALRQLELDKDKLEPSLYQQEREALLSRGAAALRMLEKEPGQAFAGTPPIEGRPLIAPEWKGAAWASLAWALVGVLVYLATSNSVARRDGGSMTGNQDLGAAPSGPPPEWTAAKEKADAAVLANPGDLDALNQLTWLHLQTGDAPKAMEFNRKVMELDPKNLDGRTYRGLLAASVQMYDKALADLESVVAESPRHERAAVYRGLLLIEMGRADEAIPALEAALEMQPGNPTLTRALGAARQRVGAPPPAPPGPAEVIASGTVTLDPTLVAGLTATDVLYISVRDPAGGPPLAALKLPAVPFPATFEVTTANQISMGGPPRPVPPTVDLRVFIDKDGNPMTKDVGLPTAALPGVTKGTTGLAVELKPPAP